MRDLDFISGKFFDFDIPRDKHYLLKYFTTDMQKAFLRYVMVFGDSGDIRLFKPHTGFYCSERLVFRFLERYRVLTKSYDEAKSSLTEEGLETLQEIESGRYSLTFQWYRPSKKKNSIALNQ